MTLAKVNIRTMGEGPGADIPVHLDGVAAGMGTHGAEIGAKPGLNVGTHGVRQGTAESFALSDLGFDINSSVEAVGHRSSRFGLDRFGFFLSLHRARGYRVRCVYYIACHAIGF